MESTQITENLEECNSSESGQTTYLAYPMHDDDDDDRNGKVEDGGTRNKCDGCNEGDVDEDDDSMASDASSGPGYCHHLYIGHLKYNEINKVYGSKTNRKVEAKKDVRTKGSKKEQRATSLHGNSKVRAKKTGN